VLYVGDSERCVVEAFDVLHGRVLANRRIFATIEVGFPDGLKTDRRGNVYTTGGPGLLVFSPSGALLREIDLLADRDLEVQRHFDINEYTDIHHDNAGVPHTLVLSPGLRIERVYVGYWFWGRPSNAQLWEDLGKVLKRTKAYFDPTTASARAAWQSMQVAA